MVDGDVIALDDSLVQHNHARKIPFIYRLFDHCNNQYVNAMNIVALHAKKATGLQYPLLYSVWKQDNQKDPYESKMDLALHMLQQLRNQLAAPVKCWVAMDSWYFAKSFYLAIEELDFNWVTRAKSNTTLYRQVTIRGKKRFIAIRPTVLFKEAKPIFSFWRKKGIMCMKFKDIYLVTEEIHNGRGHLKERILKPVNAVVTTYMEEDKETGEQKQTIALLLRGGSRTGNNCPGLQRSLQNGSIKKKRIWKKKSPTAKQLPSYFTSVAKSMLKAKTLFKSILTRLRNDLQAFLMSFGPMIFACNGFVFKEIGSLIH